MSVLKNLKQSKPSPVTLALIATSAFATVAVIYHNKRIEKLEDKVGYLIDDAGK